jgi:hypothetical protein
MRVLYVASNPEQRGTLLLEREITLLQRRLADAPGELIDFRFLPDLSVEDLNREVRKFQPTIVHISAHGSHGHLHLKSAERAPGTNRKVEKAVSGLHLATLLRCTPPPQLVYLNACDSAPLAEAISDTLCMAIGTTAPITNRAALASVLQFYERLLAGSTLLDAYESSLALLTVLDNTTTTKFFFPPSAAPKDTVLVDVPQFIARFSEHTAKNKKRIIDSDANKDGTVELELGLSGCPTGTTQVVFFTDDPTFISDDDDEDDDDDWGEPDKLALDMALITRAQPNRGVVWAGGPLWLDGDCRFFAVGVVGDGRLFTTRGLVSEALERYHSRQWYGRLTKAQSLSITNAIRDLRARDGGPPPQPGAINRRRKRPGK